ncbi:MAG: EAL domain-containing protein, partial [Methylophilaceae bacterium]
LKLIENAVNLHANPLLTSLSAALRDWQPHQTIESFVANINHLIFLWLNAIQDGASPQSVLRLLQCFELKSILGISSMSASSSSAFHLFLFDLVTETSHRHHQLTLDYLLNYDVNTQSPHVSQLLPNVETAISQSAADQFIGLISLQFQSAKNNLTFSKPVTQDLNKQIAAILQQNIEPSFQLYFSGDSQFDILIPKLTGAAHVNLLVAKISRAFEQMLFLNQQSILVTPFVGCAFGLASAQNASALFYNARLALEGAVTKQQQMMIYSNELRVQLIEQSALETKVLEAFGSDNLTLFFQPIVNLKNSKCAGAELLLRWSEKFSLNVYPSVTIEILNKVGKGKLFTRWLINSACRYASELKREHQLVLYLTINLRAEDLYDTELPHLLSQAIALWKIDAKSIVLEITENGILEYNESANSVIHQLSALGFKFALDDFGTGFSSLSRLRTMPIDLIKIDQSFVRDISHSKDDFKIVQSIAMLAKSLGKEVLAEGVEDKDCLALIKKLKIDKCQGYYYAKPMAFEQFVDWAKAH